MIGFIYLLRNEFMPDVYKLGCTERSPHERAAELSKATGVPAPFNVVCFIEVPDFQRVEQNMHDWCKEARISDQREFFHGGLPWMLQLLWHHPSRLSFTLVDEEFVDYEALDRAAGEMSLADLPDPWAEKSEPLPEAGKPALSVVGSAASA